MRQENLEASRLEELARVAVEIGATDLAAEAQRLAERVAEGRFYLACVGQFKRGKSTLLNALVGDAILPTGVVPVTAVVTILRFGHRRSARVRLAEGGWQAVDPDHLSAFVSEEENPQNEKGVTAVEVFLPNLLLASGMCLVDTPGLGSVFAGNTAATRAFVPHIDAALVVVGADPPISGEELSLVEEVAAEVRDLVFVLNKADRLSQADRVEAVRFTERILAQRLRRPVGRIYQVSAVEHLRGDGSAPDWDPLVRTLDALARRSGAELVHGAEQRGIRSLSEKLRHDLEEARRALLRPLEESERRIEELRKCVEEANRSMNDLRYLLHAEQDRLGRTFRDRRERFLAMALPESRAELGRLLNDEHNRAGSGRRALRERAQRLARETAKRWLDHWLEAERPLAEEAYREATARFVELTNGFLRRLADAGGPTLASLPTSVDPEVGFRTKSRLYYTELMRITSPSLLRSLRYLTAPAGRFLQLIETEVGEYLHRLISTNSARVESDFEDRVLESRRRFEVEIRSRLKEAYASAERALERAKKRRADGEDAVQRELVRIEELRARLEGRQAVVSSTEVRQA